MPVVSIIIPVYNAEKYLWDCLNSVSQQLFSDFEVILVDDGSIDSSGKICDEYACIDSRFSVLHTENRGVASARNTGLDHANGDWIVFVDSDDTVLPGYLNDMISLIDNKTQLVTCDTQGVEKGNIISGELTSEFISNHHIVLNGSPVNKIFQRHIINACRIEFPVGISTMEDNLFVWDYIKKCSYISISTKNNYNYNIHDNSLVRSVHHMNEICSVCDMIMKSYIQLQEKFHFNNKTINELDSYLYIACLKRLLISDCRDLSFLCTRNIIMSAFESMWQVIYRLSINVDLPVKDKVLVWMMKNRMCSMLASVSKLNNLLRGK